MAFEEALTDFGIALSSLRIVIELPSNEAIRAAVEAGMGAAVLSASVADGRALLEMIAGRRRRSKLSKATGSEHRETKVST